MKYINELLALVGLALITYGLLFLYGRPITALIIGIVCLLLALFKPTLEALRGNYAQETSDTQSSD